MRDVADIYIFPNTLAAVRITGAGIQEWLERSSNVFMKIDPGVREPPRRSTRKRRVIISIRFPA